MSERMKILASALAVIVLVGMLVVGTVLAQGPTAPSGLSRYANVLVDRVAQTLGPQEQKVTDVFAGAAGEVAQAAATDQRIIQAQMVGQGNHPEGDHPEGSCPYGMHAPASKSSSLKPGQ